MQARRHILVAMDQPFRAPNTLIRPRDLTRSGWTRILFSKVPEVTLAFWAVKVLSTTVGVTAADFLARRLALGLTATTAILGLLLATALIIQFSLRRHVPAAYWLVVVLASAVGTLLADDLVVNLGVGLPVTTALFAIALLGTFVAWYRSEQTLSVHTIVTRRREAFYWSAILLTFALGTSVGDLLARNLPAGAVAPALVLGVVLAGIAAAYRAGASALAAFWAAYVLTHPFGAATGDLLAAAPGDGGLGLGSGRTSALFLLLILAVVTWFTLRGHRRQGPGSAPSAITAGA